MTERQIETAKKLMVEYGLSEDAIRSYLGRKEDSLLEKHLYMLCRILGINVQDWDMDNDKNETGQGGIWEMSNSVDRLDTIMREHYKSSGSKEKSYEQVIQFILNDSGLSASQIEQLRLAAQAGVPEDEVLKMAKGKKEPVEFKRCVEFFQMVQQRKGKSAVMQKKFGNKK